MLDVSSELKEEPAKATRVKMWRTVRWLGGLSAHFKGQFLIGGLMLGLVAIVAGRWKLGAILGGLGLLNGWGLRGLIPSSENSSDPERSVLRVGSFNVRESSTSYHDVTNWLEASNCDLYILSETSTAWVDRLRAVEAGWKVAAVCEGASGRGISVLTRRELEAVEILNFTGERASIAVKIRVGNEAVWVLGVHPPSPRSGVLAISRDRQLRAAAKWLKDRTEHGVMIGDMNAAMFTRPIRDALLEGGLRGAWRGYGWHPTWRRGKWWWPLAIPIDHALVSEGLTVHGMVVGPYLGSDHKVIEVAVSVANVGHRHMAS